MYIYARLYLRHIERDYRRCKRSRKLLYAAASRAGHLNYYIHRDCIYFPYGEILKKAYRPKYLTEDTCRISSLRNFSCVYWLSAATHTRTTIQRLFGRRARVAARADYNIRAGALYILLNQQYNNNDEILFAMHYRKSPFPIVIYSFESQGKKKMRVTSF